MDGRHALRIGADQRPQGFTILGQHPLGANDPLASGELFGPGVGHIHTVFQAAPGPVLVGFHRESGNALQLLQQRDFLERRLHGEIELRHAAGDVELNAGGLRQPGVFLANSGGDPGAIGPQRSIFSCAPTPTVFSVYQGRFYPPAGSMSRAS